MQWKSRGECSKLTPPFTISRSEMHFLHSNSARGATCNRDHSTPTRDGLNGNGKSDKARKESPFACPCRSKKPPRPMASKMRRPNRKHATPSGFGRIGLCSYRPRERAHILRRFPALTSTGHFVL